MPVPEDHDPKSMEAPTENMKAADYAVGQKWSLKIRDVVLVTMDARPGEEVRPKYALYFEGKKLRYVANVTARKSLQHMLGPSPNAWIGCTMELGVFLVEHNKQMVNGFKVISATKLNAQPAASASEPDF